jgi:hypothetical protein
MPPCRDDLLVAVVTVVVPDVGETTIINGNDNHRPTFRAGTSVGELPTAAPEN